MFGMEYKNYSLLQPETHGCKVTIFCPLSAPHRAQIFQTFAWFCTFLPVRSQLQKLQVEQAAGYLIGYQDVRAIMDKLEIPDKGVEDFMLKYPINDWLAKTKRRGIMCVTVGNPRAGFHEDGVLLVTHIRVVR